MATQLAVVPTEAGACTAALSIDAHEWEVSVSVAGTRRARWWIGTFPPQCDAETALARWTCTSLSVAFLDEDTPDEDTDACASEACRVSIAMPAPLTLDLAPASDRQAAALAARFFSAHATRHTDRVASLEAALHDARAALDAERAKYRDVRLSSHAAPRGEPPKKRQVLCRVARAPRAHQAADGSRWIRR